MSDSSCVWEYGENGRRGIGVDQPQSGRDYPLMYPSQDIEHLLADFGLVFDPPIIDGVRLPPAPPFRIHWLYGLGCEPPFPPLPSESSESQTPEGYLQAPYPRHAADIIVVDRDDQIVFDSTGGDVTYTSRDWGDRLAIHQWEHPTAGVLSLVAHTVWAENGPLPQDYPLYFFPEQAILDPRAITPRPRRVRSVYAAGVQLAGPVEMTGEYNMAITTAAGETQAGRRPRTRITLDASPGGGLGTYPDCEPPPLVLRTINGVGPSPNGDFFLSADGCYFARSPTAITSTAPRLSMPQILLFPGNVPEEGLPAENAGASKEAAGWPPSDSPAYAHLQLGNDCQPCCACDDFVDMAYYMNDLQAQYAAIGLSLEQTRDLHHENLDRWLASLECRQGRSAQLVLQPQYCPFLDIAAQYCNQSSECQHDVEFALTVETTPEGGSAAVVAGYTFITGANRVPGQVRGLTERYTLGGSWPSYSAQLDSIDPGQSGSIRFRLNFANCGEQGGGPLLVTVRLAITVDGEGVEFIDENGNPVSELEKSAVLDCPAGAVGPNLLDCLCG